MTMNWGNRSDVAINRLLRQADEAIRTRLLGRTPPFLATNVTIRISPHAVPGLLNSVCRVQPSMTAFARMRVRQKVSALLQKHRVWCEDITIDLCSPEGNESIVISWTWNDLLMSNSDTLRWFI